MPNKFCLHKDDIQKFKEALRSGRELDPEKLRDMSSDERRAAFSKILGDENAAGVNALFESKLLLKNQQAGLQNWAKTVAGVKPEVRRDIVAKIEKLDTLLSPTEEKTFLKDLAAQKIGVEVSYDEVKQIAEHVKKLKELSTDADGKPIRDQFGNPTREYFKQLNKTKEYIQSLNEKSLGSHAISIARNFLLASIKTPLKVTVEQTLNQGIEGMVRAISYGKGGGIMGANPKLAFDYARDAAKTYRETNYNLASMNSLTEGNMFGDIFSHHEGQSTGARGLVRRFSKGLDHLVIHHLHGVVFSAHFNAAFADSANRESTRLAKSEGLKGAEQKERAAELFKEATKIGTTNPIASKIRAQGQEDAMRVTNTNTTIGSKWGAGVKNMLNTISGPIRLGDWTVPFSKIPGSIYSNAVDVAGAGIPRAFFQLRQAVTEGKETGKYNFQQPIRTLLRTVGGLAAAALLAASLSKDDYDEKKGMIKVGGIWVSTELLGPLGPALTGFLQARDTKWEKNSPFTNAKNATYSYGAGVLEGAKRLPGISEIKEISDYGLGDYLKNFVTSRIAPSILTDAYRAYEAGNPLPILAGAKIKTDAQVRNTDKDRFDPSRVSPGALEAQTKHARFNKEMDMIDAANAQGIDTSDLKRQLKGKLARSKTPLTEAEADRANKLLGTNEYKAEITNEDAAERPNFHKYNKNADGIIDKIVGWAKGIGMHPIDAFDKLVKGESFKRLENGVIIVDRMSEKDSNNARNKLGGGGQAVKLDHTVPLELGGTNDPGNFRLVTTEEWASYSPVENYLAGALHDGKITGDQAQKMIVDFKNGKLTKADIQKTIGEPLDETEPAVKKTKSLAERAVRGDVADVVEMWNERSPDLNTDQRRELYNKLHQKVINSHQKGDLTPENYDAAKAILGDDIKFDRPGDKVKKPVRLRGVGSLETVH